MMQLVAGLFIRHENLGSDLLPRIIKFTNIAACLKNDIILVQAADHFPDKPPLALPPSIIVFLGRACDLSHSAVVDFWDSLKETVWEHDPVFDQSVEDLFQIHGRDLGFRESSE